MDEFVLIFRMDITNKESQPSPKQMKIYLKQWEDWISEIDRKNKLADGGNHLLAEGKVLKSNNVIENGPYIEKGQSIAGYIIIMASNLDEAVKIAERCPILNGEGTSVEVRKTGSNGSS